MRYRVDFAIAAILAAIVLIPVSAQDIKVDVNVVNVLVSVRDGRGALVTDLQEKDFTLFEDGQRQTNLYFKRETDLPLVIAMLIDVSGSQRRVLQTERVAASQFLSSIMKDGDRAALVSFGSSVYNEQDFTRFPFKMADALDRLTIDEDLGTLLYDATHWVAGRLRHVNGRKIIVLITDGVDFYSKNSRSTVIKEAQRANASIYGIYYVDPQGYGADDDRGGRRALRALAEPTGGRFYEVNRRRPLHAVLQGLEDELRTQYSIGYRPPDSGRSFRKIKVTVPKGYTVQVRKGYYAAAGGK